MWEYRRRPEVSEWLGWIPADRADWDAEYPGRHGINVAIELDGRVIGDVMIRIGDGWGQREVKDLATGVEAELGWTLHPDFQGRGYASEAVRAVIGLCFTQLGLRREAYNVKESLHGTRGWIDGVAYALLAEEWPTPTSPAA
ncbi:N-acetyltransferase [Galactobacter valiniphilus]|uniref:N-acetyltransferase n=2 Tax=Galactobacter valiniphilus TaxID=2676122 RepID=A0A399J9P1_9MICC|nr:N-acetyltransferase [Galactobacter valiniphilus]